MKLLTKVINLIFPPRCIFCRKILNDAEICDECQKNLPYIKGAKQKRKVAFMDGCYSVFYYENKVRRAILKYKFGGAKSNSIIFGKLCADCIEQNLNGKYDIITWVPIGHKRLKKRGYDQSELIAMEAGKWLWQTPIKTLKKQRDNAAQSKMQSKERRAANVLGVYTAISDIIIGKDILIIDDILTTGATLSECARVLKTAGAGKVFAVTIAKTN